MLRSFNLSIAASLAAHIIVLALLVLVTQKEERKPPAPYFVDIVDELREPSPAPPAPLVKKAPQAAPRERPEKKPPAPPLAKPPEGEEGKAPLPAREAPAATAAEEPVVPEGKNRLFDSEVIARAAKGPTPPKEDARGITFDTEELKYQGYMRLLRDKIEGIWVYPKEAAEKGVFGDLVIRFVIRKDGALGSVKVLRTSGHGMLDEYAVKALRDGEPYWPLPEGWGRKSLTVTGHFIYTLYGVRLR
jgi:protein TonB